MRRSLGISIVALMLACPVMAFAASAWFDTNSDGLPGPDGNIAAVGQPAVFDVYEDSESFSWTNYQIYFTLRPCFTNLASEGLVVTNRITGGTNFPDDPVTDPNALGLAGFGFPNYHGVHRIASVSSPSLQDCEPNGCVTPLTDPNSGGPFCVLGAGSAYALFNPATSPPVCFTIGSTATEATTWGQVKGIFR